MTEAEVLKELEALGTEQNRKVYRRHGVEDDIFGVSYANLGKLKKKIKTDHDLAIRLWASANHDARIFATMIADPSLLDNRVLDSWVKDLGNYVLTDAFANLAGQSPLAQKKMEKWTTSPKEWIGSAGWVLLSTLARNESDLPDSYFEPYLETIEHDIHSSKNRVKHTMNAALIAIGSRNTGLEKKALATAGRIGKIEIDHGDTGCKTPDVAEYIRKIKERKSRSRKAG